MIPSFDLASLDDLYNMRQSGDTEQLEEHIETLQDFIEAICVEDCRNCGREFASLEGERYCTRSCEMGWTKFVPFEERFK